MKRVKWGPLTAVFSVLCLIVGVGAMPVASTKSGASSWVKRLSNEERRAYSQPAALRTLPVEYRRALFGAMQGAEGRATFWRSIVQDYRRTHVVSQEADALLATVENLYSEKLFSATKRDAASDERVAAARENVRRLLGVEAEETLFVYAGPHVVRSSGLPLFERTRHAVRAALPLGWRKFQGKIVPDLLASSCDCNPSFSDDCNYHQNCASPFECEVDETWPACGTLWAHPCTKLCSYDSLPT